MTNRKNPYRIAVSGAHGVGKTTFCDDLKIALQSDDWGNNSVHVVTDVARSLKAEGIPINQETVADQYAPFFERHFLNLFVDNDADFVIYDRTILDSLGYATANGNLALPWMRLIKTIALRVIPSIRIYFFIRIEFDLEDDGVRHIGSAYQAQVDQAIMEVLRECRPDAFAISGDRRRRVRQALSRISALPPGASR